MRRWMVLGAVVVSLIFPAAVTADTTGYGEPPAANSNWMEISVQKISLTAKVVAQLEIQLTCSPKGYNDYPYRSFWDMGGLQAWVKQASGRSIAFGVTDTYFDADAICDGQPHLFQLSVSADPAGVPFKSGTAAVAVAGYAGYYYENVETWDDNGWISHHASTGWMKVRFSGR